jgi:tetratricopeptide (TPR) repeat protein
LSINPEDENVCGKGTALGNLGNYTGAIEYYDKTLAIDPKHIASLDGLALADVCY